MVTSTNRRSTIIGRPDFFSPAKLMLTARTTFSVLSEAYLGRLENPHNSPDLLRTDQSASGALRNQEYPEMNSLVQRWSINSNEGKRRP